MRMERFDPTKPALGVVTQENIPKTPPHAVCSQTFDLRAKDVFHIFDDERRLYTSYQMEEWVNLGKPGDGRLARLRSPEHALVIHLSNWQIAYLQSNNRIIPVGAAAAKARGGATPGYAHSIKGARKEKAERLLLYVDAVYEAYGTYSNGKPTRKVLERAIKEFAEKRGEKPPSRSVVCDRDKRLRDDRNFDRLAAVADRSRPGNRSRRKPDRAEQAVRQAIDETLFVKGEWSDVKSLLFAWSRPGAEFSDLPNLVRSIGDVPAIISDRTIQRRLAAVDDYSQDLIWYGQDNADKMHAVRIRQVRPEHVLDIVDVDHTTLGIVVLGTGVAFGRPDLVLFRDRYSGVVLGWAVSFGPPSYETFLEGLLHAMSPKEPENLPDGVTYPWHGRPFRLGVDNAKHLIGLDIHATARQLGMQTVTYRPGHPWEKGALEHLFHILNVSLIDMLPGATAMSPSERMKFDDDKLMAVPQIELAELNGFLAHFFANIYHIQPRQGLGRTPTARDVSADIWRDDIRKVPPRPLQDQSVLVRLAGHSRQVGISATGTIRWDNIEYQSAHASALKHSGVHKRGEGKFHGTKYRAVRDPADLSKIWIEIPWDPDRYIEVPVSGAFASYANGLTVHQHSRIQEHHRKRTNEAANAPALLRAKAELTEKMVELHKKRRTHGTALQLARFTAKQATRIERARPVVIEEGVIKARLDLANPQKASRLEPRSPLAKSQMPIASKEEHDLLMQDPGTNDAISPDPAQQPETAPQLPSIDDIAARNEEWDD